VADGGAMAHLARPDLARSQSTHDEVRPGPARLIAELSEALQAPRQAARQAVRQLAETVGWQVSAGQPVPGWAVATAALSPALLISGWLIAGALQPASYSAVQQTMSVLAGQTGTDPWVMTGALFLVGCCQLATGVGLTRVRTPARVVLILTGLSTIGVAASPEAATGATPRHLAFAVSCVVTTLVWPVFAAQREPARPRILSIYSTLVVTAVFAALSGWLLVTTQGGGDLGLAERLTSSAQGLWPLVVVLALRQAETSQQAQPSPQILPSPQTQPSPQADAIN
jgi:hypothetical membrane protein